MTRPLQRRKNRSSLPRVRQKPPSKKRLNIHANPIVAANWNPKLTLSQNYRRLGLSAKLNSNSGGVEKDDVGANGEGRGGRGMGMRDPLNITSAIEKKKKNLEVGDVRVVRDEEGRIVDVLREGKRGGRGKGQWGVPLNEEEDSDESGEGEEEEGEGDNVGVRHTAGIIPQLEEASRLEKKPRPRKQSRREGEWIAKLVDKWGDDVGAMARDRKLNPMQQTEGDVKRRVQSWRKARRNEMMGDATMDVG